jgi:hypothetical protein
MGEFLETLKRYRSRIGLRDATTAITSASIVIVLALIAFAFQSNADDTTAVAGDTTDLTDTTGVPLSPDGTKASAEPGVTGPTGTGPGGGPTSSGPAATAPERVPPNVAITKDIIKIGLAYNEDPGAANAAAGFGGVGQVDQKRALDAMIAEINKNPPHGRKAVPVYYSFTTDELTSKGAERIYQEACAKWTQDNKVFMAWASGDDTLNACLSKANVVQLGGSGGFSYSKTYKDFPLLVEPGDAAIDRMAQFEVDQLFKQKFFSEFKENSPPYTPQRPVDGKARIGLIRYDQPSYDAAAASMKKALASHGLSLCSGCEFKIAYSSDSVPEQLDDATEVNSAIQNCKSRPGGPCTHMLFLGSTAGVRITLFFLDGAEKQAYRPRLGFNPLDAPTAATDFLGPSSYPQMRDSMIVSDSPIWFSVQTDAFKKCKAIFEKAGETFSGDEASNKENQIPGYCDAAWYFIAAMLKAGPQLTLDTWLRAVDSVDPVPSASVYLMRTKAGRHDGSSAIRVGAWAEDCDCFKPKTGIIPV